jgi:ADP-heptose:LPS heptosyltransferase
MKFTIECSIGEIIDKITILKIKKTKTNDESKLKNIEYELQSLIKTVPIYSSNINNQLFLDLEKVNNTLWILEDIIREKSEKKEFDNIYINTADSIHVINDKRFVIKKKINLLFDSDIVEEKIYKNESHMTIEDNSDKQIKVNNNSNKQEDLLKVEYLYNKGKYEEAYELIKILIGKVKSFTHNEYIFRLLYNYNSICNIFKIDYNTYIDEYLNYLNNLHLLNEEYQLKYLKSIGTVCLMYNKFNLLHKYNLLGYSYYVTGPNISPKTANFVKENETNKLVFLYMSGGIGDKIMYFRFIPMICNKYKHNKFLVLVNDNLLWMFKKAFIDILKIENLSFLLDTQKDNILNIKYDYHFNITDLTKYLNINNISDITYIDYLKPFSKYQTDQTEKLNKLLNKLQKIQGKKYIINWKGNNLNRHEIINRQIELINLIPLFKISTISWIIVTKEITNKEQSILEKYKNIYILSDIIDTNDNAFEDTISLAFKTDGIITSDTSLAHLGGTMDINTIVLLTKFCEFRWGNENKTQWYPNMTLLRQAEFGNWTTVINNLLKII